MSNIEKLEPIKIDGSTSYCGGEIYFCSFNLRFNEAPNELQINVINDKGKYALPKVNLSEKKDIKIGSMELGEMVAYKYRERFSSQGKMLEIYFIDGSYILDKIFIGLIGKHGWTEEYKEVIKNFNEKPFTEIIGIRKFSDKDSKEEEKSSPYSHMLNKNFYLIGRQFHPCDTNKDNLIEFKEASNFDFCDPCPSCPEDKYENRCKELSYMQIFDVGYSLKDLEDMFKEFPISLDNFTIELDFGGFPSQGAGNKNPKEFFYRDHFGTLREVLNAWANDFGCVWYYEQNKSKNTIKFIDISSKEIDVNPERIIQQYKENLISYEKEETAENTVQRGNISWYERAGEKKEYSCSKATTVILSALYGADFIGNKSRETIKGLKYNSNFYMMGGALKAYNPTLRNIWWLRNVYEITEPESAAEYITPIEEITKGNNSSSSSSDEEAERQIDEKIIYEMGNMRILSVVTKEPLSAGTSSSFHQVAKNQYNNLKNTMNGYERVRFEQKSGYFIVAYIDDRALQQIYDLEDELYDFAGRFYIREHMFRLCGITGNDEFVKNNTNIESADGSAQIYSKKDGIGSNPLSKFKYYKSGYLGCIVGKGNISDKPPASPSEKISETQGFQIKPFNGNNVLADTPDNYSTAENIAGTLFSQKSSSQHVPKLEQTAIILERQPKWSPEPEIFQSLYNTYITEKYADYELKTLGSDGMPSSSKWIINALGQNTGFLSSGHGGKIKVFVAYPGNLEIEPCKEGWTKTRSHPTDQLASKTRKVLKRVGGKFAPETPIGLLNNKCHEIKFKDEILSKIITPPHTFIPKDADEDELIEKTSEKTKPCDSLLKTETFRVPAYRIYVSQSFNQTVTLPKIQSGAYSNMECAAEVRSFEVNHLGLSDDDFFAFTGNGGYYGCIPNVSRIGEIHQAYTGTSYSNLNTDKAISIQSKKLPDFSSFDAEIKKGLSNLEIQISENGLFSTITYNTRLIKSISSDLLKFNNTKSFGNRPRGNV